MAKKLKKKNTAIEMGKMFLVSIFVAMLVCSILLVLAAVLLDKMGLSEKQVQLLVYVVYIVSAMAAGWLSGIWQREKKFVWGAITGTVWLILILILSIVINREGIEVKELFPAAVCTIGGGMIGGMLS